ncbi:MAG: patatin-like phospholipase family protein [Cyclobacteriaceae bacterium]|nr:patatin-like phospholipase family protein [Cyclobacteriaceae bacterium]
MNRSVSILIIIFFISLSASAQQVGVVLSGGGAKGLAHIGVLKALEENEIPIDYIVGTSMGGIVAGAYAAGMSPEQIEDIALSKEFMNWITGQLEEGYNYQYSKKEDYPSFIRFNISLDSAFGFLLNSSIASDLSLNFALAEMFAQASAISKNNFDSLFIPLRVVAADIFTQTSVVFKNGILSDALRATQTVPFFYLPIKVDNKYLFDGGVYNNFPIDVMERDFNPQVIIGSNVSTKVFEEYPYGEDDKLISKSLLYMLLDKSDPAEVPENGIYIQPSLKPYTAFDFRYAKSMIDSGYQQTLRQIEEIKKKISDRRTCESVAIKRNIFNSEAVPWVIEDVKYSQFNSKQRNYLNKVFQSGKRPLNFSDVKKGYYKLVSEDYFKSVYPGIVYDTAAKIFNFRLSRRPQNNFQIDFGGMIATRNISTMFLGLHYYYFNRTLNHSSLNFYAGSFAKSAEVKYRMDLPYFGRFYIEPQVSFNSWDYLEGKDIVVDKFLPTVLDRIDRKVGVSIGFPMGRQYKASLHGFYLNNDDKYINTDVITSIDTLDRMKLNGFRTGISLTTGNLNKKQYASAGKSYSFNADWFSVTENYTPGSTSMITQGLKERHSWIRARISLEQYFKSGFYSSGYIFEGVLSNQPLFVDYQGSLINAPGFYPLQDSKTLFLQNFRAYNYVAGGWRNVFALRNKLDFRLEGYLFKPLEAIVKGQNQEGVLDDSFNKIFFTGTAGLVYHSTVGPISLSFNYYDDRESQLGILLHVGFLLFNKTSMEQ